MLSRKTVLIILMSVVYGMSDAQAQEGGRFEPQVRFSYDMGVNKMKPNTLSAEFIAGLRTSDRTRVGVGVGISSHSHLFPDEMMVGNNWDDTSYKTVKAFPFFLTTKHNFSNHGKLRPYVGIDVGCVFYHSKNNAWSDNNQTGLFLRPQMGVDLMLGKARLSLECSFRHSKLFEDTADIEGWFSQVGLSLGYSLIL